MLLDILFSYVYMYSLYHTGTYQYPNLNKSKEGVRNAKMSYCTDSIKYSLSNISHLSLVGQSVRITNACVAHHSSHGGKGLKLPSHSSFHSISRFSSK